MPDAEAVDVILDHVEDREHQLRQSVARLKVKVASVDVEEPKNFQADLAQAVSAGIMLPALPMK